VRCVCVIAVTDYRNNGLYERRRSAVIIIV
jgi:hypothetical protein